MGECLIIRGGGGTDTSDATASAGHILSGYTAYVNDTKISGSMTNRGAVTSTLAPGGSYTIAAGWHNGSGVISTSTLAANTSANVAASQMLSGYTGWVNGSKITGSMTNQGTKTYALGVNGSQTIPAGWHNGSGWVKQSGVSTNGGGSWTPNTATTVLCWSGWYATGAWTVYGNGNLAAGNIKNGVSIFGVRGTWTGWVTSPIWLVQNGNPTNAFKGWWYWTSGSSKTDLTSKTGYFTPYWGDGAVHGYLLLYSNGGWEIRSIFKFYIGAFSDRTKYTLTVNFSVDNIQNLSTGMVGTFTAYGWYDIFTCGGSTVGGWGSPYWMWNNKITYTYSSGTVKTINNSINGIGSGTSSYKNDSPTGWVDIRFGCPSKSSSSVQIAKINLYNAWLT